MSHALFLVNAFAASWAESFVRACWQGGLGIALVWLLCRLWPSLPPVPRCRLWGLAYAKLLLGLVWLPPLALPFLPRPHAVSASVQTLAPGPKAAPALPLSAPQPLPDPIPARPMPPKTSPTLPTAQTWILAAWLAGVLVGVGPLAASWRRVRHLYHTSTPLADEALRAEAADLCRRFGLSRVPLLRVADSLGSPVLLGLGQPIILLPNFVLADVPRAELRLMLTHELAHLARRDLLWNALPLLAQRLFFFHPLVWLAGHEWSLAQEIACDALAVQVTGSPPAAYGRMLLGIATRRRTSAASLFPTLAVAAPRHTLRRRLFAMQHLGTASRSRAILAAALTAALALGGLVPWRVVAQSRAALPTSTAAAEGDNEWQKQERKQQTDIALKNAQLDAQLAEVQRHLLVTQSKAALAYVRWINAAYATSQLSVQLLEQQRADYVATHPNSLTNDQIAFVQKVILSKLNHNPISKNVRVKLAAIPANQQDRVATLRYYDLHITSEKMRALVEKQANVFQLQVGYGVSRRRHAGKLPTQSPIRQTTIKAAPAPPHPLAAFSALEQRLYYFAKPGHRVRISMQDATGQHLVTDKVSDVKPIVSPPVRVQDGDKIDYLVYDNGKRVKNRSL